MNMQRRVKMFLTVITAQYIGASNWLFSRRCHVNPKCSKKFIPQIWSASPIQDINTSAPIYWRWHVQYFRQYYWLRRRRSSSKNFHRFAYLSRHRLLILLELMETEIKSLQGTTCSNCKQPTIATVPGWWSMIVSFPTHLFFRYYLPLRPISIPSSTNFMGEIGGIQYSYTTFSERIFLYIGLGQIGFKFGIDALTYKAEDQTI
jgi:hypothetical protein